MRFRRGACKGDNHDLQWLTSMFTKHLVCVPGASSSPRPETTGFSLAGPGSLYL